MPNLPADGALPGLRLGQANQSPPNGPASASGSAVDQGNAFNAALAEGASRGQQGGSGNGSEGTVRPDVALRPDAGARPETSQRPAGATVAGSPAPRSGEGAALAALDAGKLDLPVLQLGASDRTVALLQRSLAVLGYQHLLADGVFGPKTDDATRSFQTTRGLAADGVVGNRETWPALNHALVARHDGITKLAAALGADSLMAEPQRVELGQLSAVLVEFGPRPDLPQMARQAASPGSAPAIDRQQNGGETLNDVARMFGLPVSALIAANPELTKPYLILQGQILVLPNRVNERRHRRPPRQLHPADPEGFLADPNMNTVFVERVNAIIARLRGEGFDVRVIAGFRSFAEQQRRFEQGRTVPGPILTPAEAGHSWHNYGLAVDIILNDEDGRPAWPEDSALFWQRLGDVALEYGVLWGGISGYPAHIEYHPRFGRGEAGFLIEAFESNGLEAVWDRIAPAPPPAI